MYIIKLKTIFVYLLIFNAVLVLSFAVRFSKGEAEEKEFASVPIIMYHSICDDGEKASKFVINKGALERDLKYITDNGYTTVSSGELISYVENGTPLPEKPIMLTFDDGYFNNYCYAYPLLKKYNAKAVISIIGKYTDLYSETDEENPNYSHITWEQAREMYESGLVEIQNHSYDSHTLDKGRNGTKMKNGETETAYASYILSDLGRLQQEVEQNLGYTPLVFAYPFGSVCEEAYDILKDMGFKVTLSCEEKVNKIRRNDSECLYMMYRYLRTNNRSVENILKNSN